MTCTHCGIVHDAQHPEADCPAVLFEEILQTIEDAIANQPRTLQRTIGPSELGEPCPRALIHKLGGTTEPTRSYGPDGYRAWVGGQMHHGFEDIFGGSRTGRKQQRDRLAELAQQPRYLTESRVSVGHVNGVEIIGANDLFDVDSGTVWDWKTKGKSRLEEAARDIRMGRGPGPRYRIQQHLYGRGQQRAGHEVHRVGIVYTPRDGNLRDSFYWSEPYSEQVAIEALNRATGLAQLVAALGVDGALGMYPQLCDGEFCPFCGPKRKALALKELQEKRGETATAATLGDLIAATKGR